MDNHLFKCPHCHEAYSVLVDYLSMSGDWRLRCDSCPIHIQLSAYSGTLSNIIDRYPISGFLRPEYVEKVVERNPQPCSCGGLFRVSSPCRCYRCCTAIPEQRVRAQILSNAETKPEHRAYVMANHRLEYKSDTELWYRQVGPLIHGKWWRIVTFFMFIIGYYLLLFGSVFRSKNDTRR